MSCRGRAPRRPTIGSAWQPILVAAGKLARPARKAEDCCGFHGERVGLPIVPAVTMTVGITVGIDLGAVGIPVGIRVGTCRRQKSGAEKPADTFFNLGARSAEALAADVDQAAC